LGKWELEHPTDRPIGQVAQRRRHVEAGPVQQPVGEVGREAQATYV
jgi:hypothetical protein